MDEICVEVWVYDSMDTIVIKERDGLNKTIHRKSVDAQGRE